MASVERALSVSKTLPLQEQREESSTVTTEIQKNHKAGRYGCKICGKKFVKPSYLQRHNVVHLKQKPFQCSACSQRFSQKVSMQRHYATQHNADFKRYQCATCPLSFSQKSNLRNHEKNVHPLAIDEHNARFACNQCTSVYRSKHTLQRHINRMHASANEITFNNSNVDDDLALTKCVLNQIKSFQIGMNVAEISDPFSEIELNSSQQSTEETSKNAMQMKEGLGTEEKECYVPCYTRNKTGDFCPKNAAIGSLKCTFCDKAFNVKAQLQVHLKSHRFDEQFGIFTKHYICALCCKAFSSLCKLDNHVITHSSTYKVQYKCVSCKGKFQSSRKLAYHRHKEKDWHLKYLQNLVPTPIEVYANPLFFHSGEKVPRNCNFKCLNKRVGESKWKCDTCNRLFSNSSILYNHRRVYHGAYRRTRQISNTNVIRCFKCTYCAQFFKTSTHCKTHMLIHIKRLLNTGISKQTEIDQQVTLIKAQAIVTDVVSGTVRKVVKFNVITRKEKFGGCAGTPSCHKCPICSSQFRKASDLQRHLVVHTGERTHECHMCEKRFGLKSTLKQHLLTHATEERPKHVCIVCGKTYASKKSLNVHLRLHTGVQPFKCENCELRFHTSGQRIAHLRVVHGLQRFVCVD